MPYDKDQMPSSVELQSSVGSPESTGVTLVNLSFPEGGLRAWLVVIGAFAICTATFGIQSSIGVFQEYWESHQLSTDSSSAIGWISSVAVFWNLFLVFIIGPCFDRFGSRWLMIIGGIGYFASIVLLASCSKYWHFLLDFGFLMGISTTLLTMPAISSLSHWFQKKRGLATGIAFMGSSIGGIVFPITLQESLAQRGWYRTMLLVSFIVFVLLALGISLIRGRLPPDTGGVNINLKAFKDFRFVCATIGVACFEFVLYGVLGLLPTWASDQRFSTQTSFNIIAILNAGSAIGRVLSGFLSDKYGRFNTLLLVILLSIIFTFTLWLPINTTHHNNLSSAILLYFFAPLFGFASGSIISLAPVCSGSFCEASEYGQFYGTMYVATSFATLVSIPIGGAILESSGVGLILFFSGILVVGLACFVVGRWASLGYKWKWFAIV